MKVPFANLSRRKFLGVVTAAGMASRSVHAWRSQEGDEGIAAGQAPDGPVLKAGLIGCGGRGRGAALNFLDAGPSLQITALGDVFPERVEQARALIHGRRGQEVPESNCFVGFDAYLKVIESGVDVILDATPPHFRPLHFAAAVQAGKHAFLEKPVAVDPTGVRSALATARKADKKGLSVMTGTQLRRDRSRIETRQRVLDGAIGQVLAVQCFRNQGALWYRTRQPGWSDMEYMIRDWVNWRWLSGDHIVEQFIHELDQIHWFLNSYPVKAVGMGGRARRPTGDQYDFFSIDYEFEDGVHMHATTRQVNGCENNRSLRLVGDRGTADCEGAIYDRAGHVVWRYEGPRTNSLVQEHVDWVTAIRSGNPINEAVATAASTLVAIMGRESAYTGRAVAREETMESDMRLGPTEYAMGPLNIEAVVPIPGVPAPERAGIS